MNRWLPSILGVIGLCLLAAWLTQSAVLAQNTVSWSELKTLVEDGQVESVVFSGETVVATRKEGQEPNQAIALRVAADEGFVALLEDQDVPYRAEKSWGCENSGSAPLLLMLLLVGGFLLFSRQDGNARSAAAFGRSTAAMVPEEGTGVSFADVAGVEEAAEELQEIVQFLETPERFTALGGRPPKGVLLVGPPGTGKTLLARAVAGEAGVPFFTISGSNFVEMFVGVGAARVRDLFKNATEHAPCIIFVDELDAVGRARGVAGPSSNDEREQTLNQLLVEMDGFDNRRGIIVMAATNRPEVLDPALLRAGRFDRQVLVDRPDLIGRAAILEVHSRKVKLDRSVDLREIAKLTPGFAGAELANALNEAALLAVRRDHESITRADVEDAIERVVAGLEKKNRRLSPDEKRIVAFHECGHAVCAAASPNADPVKKITIIPRGAAALGYTLTVPDEERYLHSKSKLLDRITVLFGGRAAEELVFGDVTTGAFDDIRKATDIARRMVTEYGMSDILGTVRYSGDGGSGFGWDGGPPPALSPETAETIEVEVRQMLERCHQRAVNMLVDNRVILEEMSLELIEREVLDGAAMMDFLDRVEPAVDLADPPTAERLAP
jgi:cell division protease FtsH